MSPRIPPDAAAAWARGDKIEALRLVRQRTGLGLREATQLLESGAHGTPPGPHAAAAQAASRAAADALARGDVIETIRRIRQASGLGLKEAKAVAERQRRERDGVDGARRPGVAMPRRDGLAPGEVPRSRVPWGLVTVLGVAAVAVYLFVR